MCVCVWMFVCECFGSERKLSPSVRWAHCDINNATFHSIRSVFFQLVSVSHENEPDVWKRQCEQISKRNEPLFMKKWFYEQHNFQINSRRHSRLRFIGCPIRPTFSKNCASIWNWIGDNYVQWPRGVCTSISMRSALPWQSERPNETYSRLTLETCPCHTFQPSPRARTQRGNAAKTNGQIAFPFLTFNVTWHFLPVHLI